MPNPVAQNPLLGKGGVHRKTRKAKRRAHQQSLRRVIEELEDFHDDAASEYHSSVRNLEQFDDS